MKPIKALAGGLAGSLALTLIHEATRRIEPKAPRMDKLGMEALTHVLKYTGKTVPSRKNLFYKTLAADIIGNALYFSLAGMGGRKNVMLKSIGLGLASGIGAVLMPKPMGLNPKPSNRTPATRIMTVGLYLAGGLAASIALKLFSKRS